jgi:tRNA threonylcarbamoyladenosine modification (KEOPS) complex  Pcc1 subunit
VLKPGNCVASIQLSFGKKGHRLIRKGKRNTGSPGSNFVSSKFYSRGQKLEQGMSSDAHFIRSMYMAIKPPITHSPQSSFPPSSRASFTSLIPPTETNPSNMDANTRVSYDDRSNICIEIEIESYNISSLRASINSYLRLADASYRCIVDGDSE